MDENLSTRCYRGTAEERLAAVRMLESMFVYSDRDRESRRLRTLEFEQRLAETSQDRTARLNSEAEELGKRLTEANADHYGSSDPGRTTHGASQRRPNADRAARLVQIEQLTALLNEANADRAARLTQIEQLTALAAERKQKDHTGRQTWIGLLSAILARKGSLFGRRKTSEQ